MYINYKIAIKLLIFMLFTNLSLTIDLFSEDQVSSNRIFIKFRSQDDAHKLIPLLQKEYSGSHFSPILNKDVSETYNNSKQNALQSINYNRHNVLKAEEPLLRTYLMEFAKQANTQKIIAEIQNSYNGIEKVEPYYIYKLQKFTPNDPLFNLQYSLDSILPEDAWGIERGNPGIVIAISDNGVPQQHPDLVNSLFINSGEIPNNNIDDDQNGYIDDYNGFNFSSILLGEEWGNTFNGSRDHGSIIAGIIGATFDNNIGIAGLAGNCRIFPIKAGDNNDNIVYGIESIIFAGVHQFSVLNLSWGHVHPFSEIEQNAIDYAIARGVAIVASGGNLGIKKTLYDTFYPAGYRGVLGVGEVDGSDYITSSSSMAAPVRILAPGEGNLGTGNNHNYINSQGGTSFSAPVVSAAVALARSKNPNLSPMQALEFVRQCTDDIKSKNVGYSNMDIIPGRLNLLKVVSTNPMSMPAIVPNKYLYFNIHNVLSDRFVVGDTAILKIDVTNILGSANTLKFTLRVVNDPLKSIELLDNVVIVNSINSQEQKIIGDFSFKITKENTSKIMFRLDIEGENNYHDFIKFNFVPTPSYKTFETDQIKFSLGDAGEFGFVYGGSTLLGEGFAVKGYGNQLYGTGNYPGSGVMISNNSERVAAIFNQDFKTIKKFIEPDAHINIFNDDYANLDRKIGIQTQVEEYKKGSNYFDFKVTLKNINSDNLNDVSFGYYIDFDMLNDPDSNQCEYYADIMTSSIASKFGNAIAGEIMYKPGAPVYCAVIAYSDDSNPVAQAAGLDYDFTESFETSEQIAALNSGIIMQSNRIYDRSMVVGMKFLGNLAPNETKQFHLVFAGDTNRTNLTNTLVSYLLTTDVNENQTYSNSKIEFIDFPETNEVAIKLNDDTDIIKAINIYDILGRKIQTSEQNFLNGSFTKIAINSVISQLVIIEVITKNDKYFHKFRLN